MAPGAAWSRIDVVLVDDAESRRLNRLHLRKPEPTDVLSFRYPALPGEHGRDSGEIVVNVETAVREGRRRRGASREFALYLAHGCDHLLGNDDRTGQERDRMRRRELRWLRKLEAEGLLEGLIGDEEA
jgi:rRNA maturation RNase YbeY